MRCFPYFFSVSGSSGKYVSRRRMGVLLGFRRLVFLILLSFSLHSQPFPGIPKNNWAEKRSRAHFGSCSRLVCSWEHMVFFRSWPDGGNAAPLLTDAESHLLLGAAVEFLPLGCPLGDLCAEGAGATGTQTAASFVKAASHCRVSQHLHASWFSRF